MMFSVFLIPILRNKGLDITSKNEDELLLKNSKIIYPLFCYKISWFSPLICNK